MDKFTTLSGVAAPMPMINVDTDMIIPKQYLKTIKRTGLGTALFSEMRYDDDGNERDDFVLNKPAYRGAKILVAGENFGCGSSREHAPWALVDYGIRAVISTEIADIFRNNSLKNGLLPVEIDRETHQQLFSLVSEEPLMRLTIDLKAQTIGLPDGRRVPFAIDGFSKASLLEGLDQLGYLLKHAPRVAEFEQGHPARVNTRPIKVN